MPKKKQAEIADLAKDLQKLYKKYEPTQVSLDKNQVIILFGEDRVELSFNRKNKLKIKFHTVLDLSEVETEEKEGLPVDLEA